MWCSNESLSLLTNRDPELWAPRSATATVPGPAEFWRRVCGRTEAKTDPDCPGDCPLSSVWIHTHTHIKTQKHSSPFPHVWQRALDALLPDENVKRNTNKFKQEFHLVATVSTCRFRAHLSLSVIHSFSFRCWDSTCKDLNQRIKEWKQPSKPEVQQL